MFLYSKMESTACIRETMDVHQFSETQISSMVHSLSYCASCGRGKPRTAPLPLRPLSGRRTTTVPSQIWSASGAYIWSCQSHLQACLPTLHCTWYASNPTILLCHYTAAIPSVNLVALLLVHFPTYTCLKLHCSFKSHMVSMYKDTYIASPDNPLYLQVPVFTSWKSFNAYHVAQELSN